MLEVMELLLMGEFMCLMLSIIASIVKKELMKITKIFAYVVFATLILYVLLKILITIFRI
ncbi:MAG: hypothetical protein DRN04_19540 [Thermoprotei archaeon]|nr:MAG: hypothetical protein DRN04_19540 [Thermoprotei archaeon]